MGHSDRVRTVVELIDWTLRVDPDGPTPSVPARAVPLLGGAIPARVPGAVYGDLLDAGVIPDPFRDDHERDVAWVSRTDWRYECAVPAQPGHERVELAFDGLDTVALIELDGTEIGRTRNMHRSYRFDVTSQLAPAVHGVDPHRLAVHLSSAYTEAEAIQARLGPRPGAYPEPFNVIRKMACSFGWDWGPTLVGAGIWRPARIEAWSGARIAGVRPLVDVVDGTGRLTVLVEVERADSLLEGPVEVQVALDEAVVARHTIAPVGDRARIDLEVPAVRIWQPVGHGSAERYRLDVALLRGATTLDTWSHDIGFRSVGLDRATDDAGSPFLILINGQPILVKGVNWIPDDVLPGRMTRARYERRLRQARDANVNLIRVWGGGIYEDDDFYDLCDELGLLVWQDFPFACAAYPEEEPLRGEVIAEARENVARLARHPSLVLWNGNNENLWLRGAEGWIEREGGQLSWGERYYLEDLPAIVAELDPSRPYSAGSPWSGSWEHEPNDPDHQTFHSWDVWNRQDYLHYRDSAPRFVAEFGWQAPPAWRTLRDAVSDDPISPESTGVRWHQKAADGNGKLARGLAPHFPAPRDVHSWHYLTQLNQVRAVATGIAHWRSRWPHTAGTILWQLNDLWPAISWAAIDGAGRCKPLYHVLRELYAPRLITLEPGVDGPELFALNDSNDDWISTVQVYRAGDDGPVTGRRRIAVHAAPRSVARVPLPAAVEEFGDPAREVLVADLDGHRALWYATEPRDSSFAGRPPKIATSPTDNGLEITVTATTLLRDFLVQADRLHPEAVADTGFLTLLPGESATVRLSCPEPLDTRVLDMPYALTWLERVMDSVRDAD
jgi:beta-mannosidase